MAALRPSSILLGVLVDKGVFITAALALAALVGVAAPSFQSLALALGLAATALGALIAALHARSRHLAHGFAVGAIAVAVSFGRFVVNSIWPPAEAAAQHAISWELIGWGGALLAGLLGGWCAGVVREESSVQAEPRADAKWGLWLPVFLAIIALFAFAEQLQVSSR
jgi:hypothetical protein